MRFCWLLILCLALAGCGGAPAGVPAALAPDAARLTPAGPTLAPDAVRLTPAGSTPTRTAAPPTAAPALPAAPTAAAAPTRTPTGAAPAVLMRLDPPMRGESVAAVQHRLAALGYAAPDPAGGAFDAPTEAAVLLFEWVNGLPLDGAVDAADAARLAGPQALAFRLPPPFAGRILRRGMYVHALEMPLIERLAELGYLPDAVLGQQGKFDLEHEAALRAFQRASGLPPTGALDLPTWETAFNPRALNSAGRPANGAAPDGALDAPPGRFPPGWNGPAVPLGAAPGAEPLLALAEGGKVWVARADGTLLWYEPAAGQLHGPIFIGDLNLQDSPTVPLGMAALGGRLWVYASVPGGQLLQGFDLASGLSRPPLLLPDPRGGQPAGRAFGFDGRRVWLSGLGAAGSGSGLRAAHPTNGVLIFPRALPAAPDGPLAFDGRCLWAYLLDGTITSVDPGLGACTYPGRVLPVGPGPAPRFAAHNGLVWIAPRGGALLKQFDSASGTLRSAVKFDSPIRLLAMAGGMLWAGEEAGRLTPLDPVSGARGPGVTLGCVPLALAEGGWAACGDQTLRKVGE